MTAITQEVQATDSMLRVTFHEIDRTASEVARYTNHAGLRVVRVATDIEAATFGTLIFSESGGRRRLDRISSLLTALDVYVSGVTQKIILDSFLEDPGLNYEGVPSEWLARDLTRMVRAVEPSPEVAKMTKSSPLMVDLATNGTIATAVVYLFKNPAKLGAFFPDVLTSFYEGLGRMREAKRAAAILYEANAEMESISVSGEISEPGDS